MKKTALGDPKNKQLGINLLLDYYWLLLIKFFFAEQLRK